MLQAIPLTSTLRVDIELIVESEESQFLEVNNRLAELLASETREFHIVQCPVELDVLACLDLAACGFDDVGGEQVERANLIFLACRAGRFVVVLTPAAALGLAVDFGKVVEGREVLCCAHGSFCFLQSFKSKSSGTLLTSNWAVG